MKNNLKVKYYIAGGVALAAMVIYLPALQNKFVAWDDNVYVYNNPYIRSLNLDLLKWAFSDFFMQATGRP